MESDKQAEKDAQVSGKQPAADSTEKKTSSARADAQAKKERIITTEELFGGKTRAAPVANVQSQDAAQAQQQQPEQKKSGFFNLTPTKVFFLWMIVSQIYGAFFNKPSAKLNPNYMENLFNADELLVMNVQVADKNNHILFDWRIDDFVYSTSANGVVTKNATFTYAQLVESPLVFVNVRAKSNRESQVLKWGELVAQKVKVEEQSKKNLLSDALPSVPEYPPSPQQHHHHHQHHHQHDDNYYNDDYGSGYANTDAPSQVHQQEQQQKKGKSKKEKTPHLPPKYNVILVHDTNVYPKGQLPLQLSGMERINTTILGPNNTRQVYTQYKPIIDLENFWVKDRDHTPLNSTIDPNQEFTVQFEITVYWSFKWMMEKSLMMQASGEVYQQFGLQEIIGENGLADQMDQVREMLYDNNPLYVALTMVVSLLHSVFELLAVKNDIQYWRNLDQYQGLSLQSLYSSLVQEIIIALWLFDSEDVSWMILVQVVIGLFVSVWKIYRSQKFERISKFPYFKIVPDSRYTSTTQQHDQKAHKWLYIAFVPLFIGYCVYSLVYEEHKGWYSFVLQTLVGFIYVFGFIQMFPQIYINYKLKSVEHMPWRTLIYRFLNTIIDDLFAFIITQPWLRRLACFRDDIIFVIYIYQRWAYKVDHRRTEYGFVKDEVAVRGAGANAATDGKPDPQAESKADGKEKVE